MFAQTLIVLGIAINAIGTLSYIISTIKGIVKPNKVTFFLWSFAPFVAFLAQVAQGVGIQSLMTLSICIFPLSIFIASFVNKKSYWKIQPFDLACGALSLVGLLLWYLTKVGNIAIFLSILADGLAAMPTVVKAYTHPETESSWPWLASVASGALTLVTIRSWNFQTYAFPIYYTIVMFLIFVFVQFKLGKRH